MHFNCCQGCRTGFTNQSINQSSWSYFQDDEEEEDEEEAKLAALLAKRTKKLAKMQ